jgi:hypothetical protein
VRSVGCLIPIIAHTGYTKRDWKFPEMAHQAGCNGFVEKTGDIDILPRVIESYLESAAKARALLPENWKRAE